MSHNYSGYSHGCRCSVCRQAKSDYMRGRRARARANPAPPPRHGTITAYNENMCRCGLCRKARRTADKRQKLGRMEA